MKDKTMDNTNVYSTWTTPYNLNGVDTWVPRMAPTAKALMYLKNAMSSDTTAMPGNTPERVNWRKQYKLDSIFHLVIYCMLLIIPLLVTYCGGTVHSVTILYFLLPFIGLMVTCSTMGYFNTSKYF